MDVENGEYDYYLYCDSGDELCCRAIDKWGGDLQMNLFVEECAEALKALSKIRRSNTPILKTEVKLRDDFLKELADLKIMIRQMEILFGFQENDMNAAVDFKLWRLSKRLTE
jgi:NTP pyrophosphatase (non-canonical NTP hydrolase)